MWRPIDSAPMEIRGPWVLGYERGGLIRVVKVVAYAFGFGGRSVTWRDRAGLASTPTHWKPLPRPPPLDLCGEKHHTGVVCIRERHGREINHTGRGASWRDPGDHAVPCRAVSPEPEYLACSELAAHDSEFCLMHSGDRPEST